MELVLETVTGDYQDELRIPLDVGFWHGEEVTNWPADIGILVTRNSKATGEEVAKMMEDGFFVAGQDGEYDSYDSQRRRFREEALRAAHRAIDKPTDALASVMRRIADDTLVHEVQRGQSVTLTISRDEKGTPEVHVEAR